MKTKIQKTGNKPLGNGVSAQLRTIGGKRMVLLEENEYIRLLQKADLWEPLLPELNAAGNYPAVEYARVWLARKIIRHRRRVGLSQTELARHAGIRPSH